MKKNIKVTSFGERLWTGFGVGGGLFIGALIYLLFRPRVLLGFLVADRLGLGPTVDHWREAVSDWQLPDFVVYCLPNGLWAAAWVLIANRLFRDRSRRTRLLWASVVPTMGVVSELMQGMGILPGTFDWLDLVCYAVPYMVYILFNIIEYYGS